MIMPITTLTSKGQITLPREVREHLHVDVGDRVEFVIDSEGDVRVHAVAGSYTTLRGMVPYHGAAPSDEAMADEISRLLAEDNQRILRGEG
jgi:antitoxin PrlF